MEKLFQVFVSEIDKFFTENNILDEHKQEIQEILEEIKDRIKNNDITLKDIDFNITNTIRMIVFAYYDNPYEIVNKIPKIQDLQNSRSETIENFDPSQLTDELYSLLQEKAENKAQIQSANKEITELLLLLKQKNLNLQNLYPGRELDTYSKKLLTIVKDLNYVINSQNEVLRKKYNDQSKSKK